jgi:hypothetical protein
MCAGRTSKTHLSQHRSSEDTHEEGESSPSLGDAWRSSPQRIVGQERLVTPRATWALQIPAENEALTHTDTRSSTGQTQWAPTPCALAAAIAHRRCGSNPKMLHYFFGLRWRPDEPCPKRRRSDPVVGLWRLAPRVQADLGEGLRAFGLWRERILADKERREALDGHAGLGSLQLRSVAERHKSSSNKKNAARALLLWHNAVFAADAAVRVAWCGGASRPDARVDDAAAVPSVQRDGLCASSEPIPAGGRRAWAFCTAWPTVVVISVLERVNASVF